MVKDEIFRIVRASSNIRMSFLINYQINFASLIRACSVPEYDSVDDPMGAGFHYRIGQERFLSSQTAYLAGNDKRHPQPYICDS